nr:PREDICTED: alpha-glucosidase-like [Bemisia tabaci]
MSRNLTILLAALSVVAGVPDYTPKEEWWQHCIFYQIYPQSFYDSNGDGIGDLKGITSKVGYLQELNVCAVWLNPIYPSPWKENGYDISNYVDIHPKLGTIYDFDALVSNLNNAKIMTVLDFVPNHTSDQHVWFQRSVKNQAPYKDYYIWRDAKGMDGTRPIPPNDWASVFQSDKAGSAWKWNEDRKQFYYHAFMEEQPDLNLRNPLVVEELKNVLRFWMDRGARGFRVDAVPHLFEDEQLRDENGNGHQYTQNLPENYDFVRDIRVYVDEYGKKKSATIFLSVEAYAGPSETMRYYGSVWEPAAHFPYNFLFLTDVDDHTNAPALHKVIVGYLANLTRDQFPNWVTGNHDWPRIPSRMGASTAVDQLNMLGLLLPGSCTVYMGDEIGMDSYWGIDRSKCPDGFKDDYRTPNRTPFHWNITKNAGFTNNRQPWIPINPEYYCTNVETETKYNSYNRQQPSALMNFKEMTKLKRSMYDDAITNGKFRSHVLNDQMYAFTRTGSRFTYLVLLNLGKHFSDSFKLASMVPEVNRSNARSLVARSANLGEECAPNNCFDRIFSEDWNMPPKSGLVAAFTTVRTTLRSRDLGEKPEPYWMGSRLTGKSN